jgi:hypothetical protein
MQRLHAHAFWVYGVIVGLAIREALVRAGSHIFLPGSPTFLPSDVLPWKLHLEAFRLIIFLMTITCFYFGSGVFFDKVYLNEKTASRFEKKSYGLDFVLGMVHYLVFFAWSLTLADHSRFRWGLSPFLLFMSAILLYDVVWFVASIRFDTMQELKLWTFFCVVVFFLAGVVFFFGRALSGNDVIAEEISFVVVGLYLLGDLVELFTDRPFFSELVRMVLPRDQQPGR